MLRINPVRHVCHEKYLNRGRKFGVPLIDTNKHAKLQQAYDRQKNVEMMGAIASNPPMNAQAWAIPHVTSTATQGSSPFLDPRPSHFV
mmetsp:Transcript_16271/g.40073  ORF Transcript_16271/g.40073 Transcript_16271/m.40073 type:complete len:88 (-) Transcript_16271:1183-1446(-)